MYIIQSREEKENPTYGYLKNSIYGMVPIPNLLLLHINKRQAPIIKAAVPVQTPLQQISQHLDIYYILYEFGRSLHQPLKCREFNCLDSLSQSSYFLLNSCFCLFDAHFLSICLFANSTFFQIQI